MNRFFNSWIFWALLGCVPLCIELTVARWNGWLVLAYALFAGFFLWALRQRARTRPAQGKLPSYTDRPVASLSRNYNEDLRLSQELLQLVVEATNDGIWDYDIPNGVVSWSERALVLVGIQGGLGKGFEVLKEHMHIEDRRELERRMDNALRGEEPLSLEVRIIDSAGSYRFLLLRGKAKRNAEGRPLRMAGSISDLTRHKEAEKELVYAAYHDVLTGVKNRRQFLERLEDEITKTARRPDYLFAVILLDIDHFKAVNDSLGHSVGDRVLQQLAGKISYCCRQIDIVARIGGDEFGILLRDMQNHGDVENVVKRIQAEVREPILSGQNEVSITLSMGIAFNSEKLEDREQVLANADTVLQKAKQFGTGRCELFTSGMREKAMELYRLERDLRKAITEHEFTLFYQPIIDIFSGKVTSLEALVRWNNGERGITSPAEFIPMAEETGLIVPLGEQILRMACTQTKLWVEAGFKDLTVAVNFSAKQFASENIAFVVQAALAETNLPPRNLKLEITEHAAMHEVERTIATMQHLTEMGLQISIDDFGTGYSSLSYLKKYPIQTLKIDRSFIKDIPMNPEDMAITRTIIAMAKSLDLNLIAEGVETKEQLEFLRSEGCQYIQGFFFSQPLSAVDATSYLNQHA
jgi:diguanylate cyclase (GGDEF)-like protein/PAS domain S-box-containing protein